MRVRVGVGVRVTCSVFVYSSMIFLLATATVPAPVMCVSRVHSYALAGGHKGQHDPMISHTSWMVCTVSSCNMSLSINIIQEERAETIRSAIGVRNKQIDGHAGKQAGVDVKVSHDKGTGSLPASRSFNIIGWRCSCSLYLQSFSISSLNVGFVDVFCFVRLSNCVPPRPPPPPAFCCITKERYTRLGAIRVRVGEGLVDVHACAAFKRLMSTNIIFIVII